MGCSKYILTFFSALFLISLVSAVACTQSDQIILSLSEVTNAHGALSYSTWYAESICFDTLFGGKYTGASPKTCAANDHNLVLTLSNLGANAHAKQYTPLEYIPTPVCYGDLICRNVIAPANCAATEKLIVSLSSATNAHLASYGASAESTYPVKICCYSPSHPNVTSTLNVSINSPIGGQVFSSSTVPLNVTTNISAQCISYIDDLEDEDTTHDLGTGVHFTRDLTGLSNGQHIIYVSCTAGRQTKLVNKTFSVNAVSGDIPPEVTITNPTDKQKFCINDNINYALTLRGVAANLLNTTWNFGDGNITDPIAGCLANPALCNQVHSYPAQKSYNIRALVKETANNNRKDKDKVRVDIYKRVAGLNLFAIITEPADNSEPIASGGWINFSGSESYISNCSLTQALCDKSKYPGTTCYHPCGELYCYDLPKTDAVLGTDYNFWFNWTFKNLSDGTHEYVEDFTGIGNFTNHSFVAFKKQFPDGNYSGSLKIGYEGLPLS
ncbi:hypothetical protein J4463_02525 [Candidatus Pacearchaeota archaeon]|nr:hypothetical protein [Candidatus Pacearchaeota archaeon]